MATVSGPCQSPWSATSAAIYQSGAQPRMGFCQQILHLLALLVMISQFQLFNARKHIAFLLLRTLFFAYAEFKFAVQRSELWNVVLIVLRLCTRTQLLLVSLLLECIHSSTKLRPCIR